MKKIGCYWFLLTTVNPEITPLCCKAYSLLLHWSILLRGIIWSLQCTRDLTTCEFPLNMNYLHNQIVNVNVGSANDLCKVTCKVQYSTQFLPFWLERLSLRRGMGPTGMCLMGLSWGWSGNNGCASGIGTAVTRVPPHTTTIIVTIMCNILHC